jgi:predicted enzyme related to lactoylglutathione lyase
MIGKEMKMQKNPVVFWELASHDMERSVQFFQKVFDWQIDFNERLGFYIVPESTPPSETIEGGIFTLKKAKLPFLAIYIQVENIEEKATLVEAEGGYIKEEPHELAGGSKICLFNEPSGVTFAMIEPGKK